MDLTSCWRKCRFFARQCRSHRRRTVRVWDCVGVDMPLEQPAVAPIDRWGHSLLGAPNGIGPPRRGSRCPNVLRGLPGANYPALPLLTIVVTERRSRQLSAAIPPVCLALRMRRAGFKESLNRVPRLRLNMPIDARSRWTQQRRVTSRLIHQSGLASAADRIPTHAVRAADCIMASVVFAVNVDTGGGR